VRHGLPYGEGVGVAKTIVLFVVAALAEIGGAWLVWQGVREHRSIALVGAGIAALGAYGFGPTGSTSPVRRSASSASP
jgi:small multidrug resistance family-3 protein